MKKINNILIIMMLIFSSFIIFDIVQKDNIMVKSETGSSTTIYQNLRSYSLTSDTQMYGSTIVLGYWAALKAKTTADNIDNTIAVPKVGLDHVTTTYYLYRNIFVFPLFGLPTNAIIDNCNLTYYLGSTVGTNFKYVFTNHTRTHTFTQADQFATTDFNIAFFTPTLYYASDLGVGSKTISLPKSTMYFRNNYLLIGCITDFDKNNSDPLGIKYAQIDHGNLAYQQPYINIRYHLPTFPSTNISIIENLHNCTGTKAHYYNDNTGWKIYNNYTGYSISLSLYQNILNCTGTHASYYNNITGWKVYNNYTGYSLILTILENLKNCTGTEQYYYNNITGWKVYNNFTGFSILLNAIENLINCTGTHASYYNSATGWKMYLNYTGNVSGGGSPVNRTINITLNGHGFFNSWNGSINTNVQNISILMNSDKSIVGTFSDNDSFYDDKYFLSGVLSIESGLLFLGICLSLWIFFISKYLEYRDMTIAYIQFGLSIPTCIIVGAFSFSYAFGFVVVFLIPILSLSLIADGYFYRKKLKKK